MSRQIARVSERCARLFQCKKTTKPRKRRNSLVRALSGSSRSLSRANSQQESRSPTQKENDAKHVAAMLLGRVWRSSRNLDLDEGVDTAPVAAGIESPKRWHRIERGLRFFRCHVRLPDTRHAKQVSLARQLDLVDESSVDTASEPHPKPRLRRQSKSSVVNMVLKIKDLASAVSAATTAGAPAKPAPQEHSGLRPDFVLTTVIKFQTRVRQSQRRRRLIRGIGA